MSIMKKPEEINLNFGQNRQLELKVRSCTGFMQGIGLMFSRREKAPNLIFRFSKQVRLALHSLFVFYDFIAVWTDSRGKVLEFSRVKPFSLHIQPKNSFATLVEIPVNHTNMKIIDEIERFK